MSTRLADLTQYRGWQSFEDRPTERIMKAWFNRPIPVERMIEVAKQYEAGVFKGSIGESSFGAGLVERHHAFEQDPGRFDGACVFCGHYQYEAIHYADDARTPLTATVPTDDKTQRKHTASLLNAMQFCGINSWRPTGTDEQGCFINDAVPFGKLSHEDALKIVSTEPVTDRRWLHFLPDDFVGDRVPSIPVDDLFRKCSHCNGSLPPMEPMTLERAVTVLNEQRYLGFDDWDSGFMVDRFSVAPVCKVGADASKNYVIEWQYFRTEFEAIACAEKLVREK